MHQKVFKNRPEAERRHECECANDHDDAGQQRGKQNAVSRETYRRRLERAACCARLPATASIGTIMRKRPANIAMPSVTLYQAYLH